MSPEQMATMKLPPKFKLRFQIKKTPSNVSLGQRQLICLARAVLQNPKILLLDESTSSLDFKTDSQLQDLILHKELQGCTILSIVHRESSLKAYDRVIEMADGQIVNHGQ